MYSSNHASRTGIAQANTKNSMESKFANCRINAIKEHLYSGLKEAGVILSLKNGKYYGLNEVGRSIWSAVQTPATIEEIKTAIMQEYDVDEATCYREINNFLEKMSKEELVEIQYEKGF